MTVTAEEFIRRYLQHVLPRGFQKIRHFGFAHSRSKTNWEWLAMMVTTTLNLVYTLIVTAKAPRARRTLKCCECGGDLELLGFIRYEPDRQSAFNTS